MSDAAFGCVKNTIRLRSGRYFDFLDPRPDQFTLADIAGALSKICRFGGQIGEFYSVAEHSHWCMFFAGLEGQPTAILRACLMHDAAEAFCGDMVKPLKVMMPLYDELESRIEKVIGEKFDIDFDAHREVVKKYDRELLIAERRHFFTPDKVKWAGEDLVARREVSFAAWPPDEAEHWFLSFADACGLAEPTPTAAPEGDR